MSGGYYRIALDKPLMTDDGHGGVEVGWEPVAEARAHIRFLRGGEEVQAGRLQGILTVVATVYSTSDTRQAKASWRMRDVRSGEVYNIRSVMPTEDRRQLEITAQSGVAV